MVVPVQLAVSPKSNQEIWLAKSVALIFVVKPGFASLGVEVASCTSSPMRFGSFGSPIERRLRRLPEVSAVTTGCSTTGDSTPPERELLLEASTSTFTFCASDAVADVCDSEVAARLDAVVETPVVLATTFPVLATLFEDATELTDVSEVETAA